MAAQVVGQQVLDSPLGIMVSSVVGVLLFIELLLVAFDNSILNESKSRVTYIIEEKLFMACLYSADTPTQYQLYNMQ